MLSSIALTPLTLSQVDGVTLYPAAGMIVMAIEAARQMTSNPDNIKGYKIREVAFLKAIQIRDDQEPTETSFFLRPHHDDGNGSIISYNFRLCTYENNAWVENFRGVIGVEHEDIQLGSNDGVQETLENCLTSEMHTYNDGRARCGVHIDSRQLYKCLETFGYGFGPCFQTLNDVQCNEDGEATAFVSTRDWATKHPNISVAEHVIHPTTLDGVLQSIFSALSKGGKYPIPTLIPTQINEMWVSQALLNQSKSSSMKIYTKSGFTGQRETNSNLVALDSYSNESRVLIEGLKAVGVTSTGAQSADSLIPKRLCFNLEFRPDLDLLDREQVLNYCSSVPNNLAADNDQVVEDIELTCFLSISQALQCLSQDLISTSKPHLARYFEWMKYQMGKYDKGTLIHGCQVWRELLSDPQYQESLFRRVESSNPEGRLCNAVRENLVPILKGDVDALGLLFNGELVDDYYRWAMENENAFPKIAKYLNAFAHKNPGLNILEIGAGTGSGTQAVMDIITQHGEAERGAARYSHYTFTDISPSFFEKARERFAKQANRMTFKVLDITADPADQDFEYEKYDLVIAVNVGTILPG